MRIDRDSHRQFYEYAYGHVKTLREEYNVLLEKYHELATGVLPQSRLPVVMPAQKLSVVDGVIRDQAGGDALLVSHLRKYAAELRRKGQSDEEVAQELMNWTTTELVEY